MPNQILSSAAIQTVKASGRAVNVRYATQTTTWKRLILSPDVQQDFVKAVENADIPPNAETAIMA